MIVASILAAEWNKLIDHLRRNRIRDVVVLENGAWRHPWNVVAQWDADNETWTAQIQPGFVNGLDASMSLPFASVPEDTATRLQREGKKLKPDESVDAWLSETPRLPLDSWRKIGPDSEPTDTGTSASGNISLVYESVPMFFLALGVGDAPKISTDVDTFKQSMSGTFDDNARARLLRALDLVLFMDRIATSTQWTTGAGIDGTFAQFSVTTITKPNARERAYIQQRSKWQPPLLDSQQDMLAGDWSDQTHDEYLLATVYLVSPEGAAFGSEPDGSWTPYVKHSLFWNLSQATNQLKPPLQSENLTLQTGLAGGVGDAINNYLLAQINDANSAAAQFLGREKIEARIWTV